jgi:two-component system, chemotaxis family, response regulator Rcp1
MTPFAGARHLDILLVDDDLGDCRLVKETLGEGKHVGKLNVVNDGDQALQYLRGQGKHKSAKRPDLVLLDLNMPRKDGFATLEDIRADRHLTDLPVIILTTSTDERDVQKSYKLHANCFVSKPTRIEDFGRVMRAIEDFWSGTARVPRPA